MTKPVAAPAETHWCITCEKWMPIQHDHPAPTERVEKSLLLTCPFCGVVPRVMLADAHLKHYKVSCGGCKDRNVETLLFLEENSAMDAWNKRAAVAPSPAGESQDMFEKMLEALKDQRQLMYGYKSRLELAGAYVAARQVADRIEMVAAVIKKAEASNV